MSYASDDELSRDDLVRKVPCPVCKAPRKDWCDYGPNRRGARRPKENLSHFGRYRSAYRAGFVRAIPGVG